MYRMRKRSRGPIATVVMDGLSPAVLVFLLFSVAGAQPNGPPHNDQLNYARFSPSMAIIIVILIAALFFMGFFSIYIRHCSDASGAAGNVRRALSMRTRRAAASRGLDASVIETFPTFTYSEVKDHKIGKGTLECAVCLNEFAEEETLRLIPKCDHVFHPECIDAWLESHVTCPVCRANLDPAASGEAVPANDSANNVNAEVSGANDVERVQSSRNDEIVVQIDDDRQLARRGSVARQSSFQYPPRPQRSWSVKILGLAKYRSHSTGHSMIQPGENLERFTLKLPEEVRKEVINRAALNRTGSSVSGSKPAGEGSNRAGRSYRRMEKLDVGAKSDRWVFFSRGLSMKSPKVVAAESSDGSGRRIPVRMPSFTCLEPKAGSDDIETRPLANERPPLPPV